MQHIMDLKGTKWVILFQIQQQETPMLKSPMLPKLKRNHDYMLNVYIRHCSVQAEFLVS